MDQLYLYNFSFYISARFTRKEEAQALAIKLRQLGYKITSTWHVQTQPEMLYRDNGKLISEFAQKDVDEVRAAKGIISLSEVEENPWGRGGRHVECGIAIERNMLWIVIGPKENIFHYLPGVIHYRTEEDFLDAMSAVRHVVWEEENAHV